MNVKEFMQQHFRHFNAAVTIDAAEAYCRLIDRGGKMFMTLAGAMSTAELGVSLAEMIRRDKVHAIACTGANLEEDIFNLVAHEHYLRVPRYRDLTPQDEANLCKRGMNRVTDTCIPEEEAFRRIEKVLLDEWHAAERADQRLFPHEFLFRMLKSGRLDDVFEIDPQDSWVWTAAEKDIPLFVPGWEDSTLGNVFAAFLMNGRIQNRDIVKTGIDYLRELVRWYEGTTELAEVGFFQIGGGIAGDFPICVVPLIRQDLKREVPFWAYFCQISDSTTSYGSYSGAVPNEKITWGKLAADTPRYIIESDATIVAPLIFAYVLGL